MQLDIDPAALAEAFSTKVLETIDDDTKEQILRQAVQHVITPTRNTYGYGSTSPLQDAFNRALAGLTDKVAREAVEADPAFGEAVREAVTKAMAAAVADESNHKLREAVSRAIFDVVYSD